MTQWTQRSLLFSIDNKPVYFVADIDAIHNCRNLVNDFYQLIAYHSNRRQCNIAFNKLEDLLVRRHNDTLDENQLSTINPIYDSILERPLPRSFKHTIPENSYHNQYQPPFTIEFGEVIKKRTDFDQLDYKALTQHEAVS